MESYKNQYISIKNKYLELKGGAYGFGYHWNREDLLRRLRENREKKERIRAHEISKKFPEIAKNKENRIKFNKKIQREITKREHRIGLESAKVDFEKEF